MVFSFFKKLPGKKSQQTETSSVKARGGKPTGEERSVGQPDILEESGSSSHGPVSGFSDFSSSGVFPDYQIDGGGAPDEVETEEAAIFYASGQDAAAQSVLEGAVKTHGSLTERPWLMLFDLYRLMGKQDLFEALGIEYARVFEKSPPGWGAASDQKTEEPRPAKRAATGRLTFKGELLGSNEAAFEAVRQALEKSAEVRLDVSKIRRCDPEGCARFLELLALAETTKRRFELQGKEVIRGLLQAKIAKGRAAGKECWLLLIELCQLQGWQKAFDKMAIGYAMTFEESPPSWNPDKVATTEPVKAVVSEPEPEQEEVPEEQEAGAEAIPGYVLRGEIKSERFADLSDYAEEHDYVMIDCSELVRMDFVSAGVLLNVLSGVRKSGKPIVLHHPNYLVAELFGIVGLKGIAAIDFAK